MKLFRQIKVGSKHQSSRFALITEHIEETANMTVSQCSTDIWQILMKLLQSTFDHIDFAFNNLKMFPFKCIKTYSAIQFGPTYILETIL